MSSDALALLASQLRESPEVREYQRLKAIVEESPTTRALLKEYRRLQLTVQMAAMTGRPNEPDDMSRFQQISSLLYAGTDTSAYLIAEMRLQQSLAEIYRVIAGASGLTLEMPGAP